MSEEKKDEIIQDLKQLEIELNKLGIEIYLHYGTLLGAVREKNLIPNDSDIDIAYLGKAKNKQEALKEIKKINKLLSKKYKLKIKQKWTSKGYSLGQVFITRKFCFDLYYTWQENGKYLCPHQDKLGNKEDFFPLIEGELRGFKFKIPKNSELLLSRLYGDDWRVPQEKKTTEKNPFKWVLYNATLS